MDEATREARERPAGEDGALAAARARAALVTKLPTPGTGSLLAWLAATVGARHVVEIGGAGGVSGLWLLRGMGGRGVLTSVETDPHLHGLATDAYDRAGVEDRVRAVLGEPATVLPRLSDGQYEVCLVQGRAHDYPVCLEHGLRLLAPGGVLVARGVLDDGAGHESVRRFLADVVDHDELTTTILPVDEGLLLATRARS